MGSIESGNLGHQRTIESELLQNNIFMVTINLFAKTAYLCAAGIALVVVFWMVTFNMPPFDLDKLE